MTKTYQLGHWTHSTLLTIEFLAEKEKQRVTIGPADLPSGTMRNWLYALRQGGYVTPSPMMSLTEKGNALLNQLRTNPPRQRKRKFAITTKKEPSDGDMFMVQIEGSNSGFEAFVPENVATELIKIVHQHLHKKHHKK